MPGLEIRALVWVAAAGVVSYLLGAMPFGYFFVRMRAGTDIRKVGSGNIGATNVARVLGKPFGILVFALDFLKGFLPVFLFPRLLTAAAPAALAIAAATGALAGHIWPVYLRFRGGKGVATGAGVFLAVDSVATAIALCVWALVVAIFRYVSLGSIVAAVALVAAHVLLDAQALREGLAISLFCAAAVVAVIWRHRDNIVRLCQGRERKIGEKRPRERRGEKREMRNENEK